MRTLWGSVMLGASVACAGCAVEADAGGHGPGSASPAVHVTFGGGPPLPKLAVQGGLSFEILDAATNRRMPGKLTILGVDGTRSPRFSQDIGVEIDSSLEAYDRVFSLTGVGVVALPLGTYEVTFSRGLEWTIATQRVSMTTAGVELHAKLQHVVDTPHWVSGDFHVHAAASPDSRVPMRDRVYEFVADGVDMIVSTDHNVVASYQPVIAELHAERYLASASGDEITSSSWGHFGAFPLPHEMETEGHGAIAVKNKSATDIFAEVRKTAPSAVIDVHHPRLEKGIGYFYLGQFDDHNDRAQRKGFSFDFDAIEVLNGYQDTNRTTIDRVMQDWFALLDHGHLVTATGNSDTHHLTYNLGGYPRNYVLVPNDDPQLVTVDEVAKGVKAHHAFFTTGPIVDVRIGTTDIGDLAPAPGGKAKAEITVRAAPWVSVSRVMIYVAGKVVKTWELPARTTEIQRFHDTWDLVVPNDTYVVVRVEGDRSLAPVVGGGGEVTVFPFALTNPIFLDANGNGKYDPPQPHGTHGRNATAS